MKDHRLGNGHDARAIDDHALMRRVRDGDRRAFAILVERHRDSLYRFILRQVRSAPSAEDLLQETFLRVYRAAADYEPDAKLSTWLFRIAFNLCLNEAAKASSRRELVDAAPDRADPQPDPAVALERKEIASAVEAAIACLPPRQRAAVQLARFEGMSYASIAKVLDTSVAAVENLLQRARQTLRQQLQHLA